MADLSADGVFIVLHLYSLFRARYDDCCHQSSLGVVRMVGSCDLIYPLSTLLIFSAPRRSTMDSAHAS